MNALARSAAPGWIDRSLRIATHAGGSVVTTVVCLTLLGLPGTRRLGMATSLANLISHSLVQLLKRLIVRPRPTALLSHIVPLSSLPDPYSFPSGHSCAAMAVAMSLALYAPGIGTIAIVLAILVGASRVYLRIHYATDVVVGQLLGAVSAVLIWATLS